MSLEGAVGVAAELWVKKPWGAVVVPNDPLLPLLSVREDLHVLEAGPTAVSVLQPRAVYFRGFAASEWSS